MKKGKVLMALLLTIVLSLSCAAPAAAASEYSAAQNGASQAPEGTWKTSGGNRYYILTNGKKYTGWLYLSNATYYLNPKKSGAAAVGVTKIGKYYFYFLKNGKLVTSRHGYKIGSKYYRIGSKGVLKRISTVEGLAGLRVDKQGKTLRGAFNWAASIKYYPVSTKVPSGTTAAKYFGEYAFQAKRGDCNVQAYAFYWMAKSLGYDVTCVRGYVPQKDGSFGAHAWCEIKTANGKTFVFDPNFAYTYGKSKGYKFTYGTKGTYQYYDKNKKKITKK